MMLSAPLCRTRRRDVACARVGTMCRYALSSGEGKASNEVSCLACKKPRCLVKSDSEEVPGTFELASRVDVKRQLKWRRSILLIGIQLDWHYWIIFNTVDYVNCLYFMDSICHASPLETLSYHASTIYTFCTNEDHNLEQLYIDPRREAYNPLD